MADKFGPTVEDDGGIVKLTLMKIVFAPVMSFLRGPFLYSDNEE